MSEIEIGQRVFHRRADLFGTVKGLRTKDGQNLATVKYEWPWDPQADPVEVPSAALSDALEVALKQLALELLR